MSNRNRKRRGWKLFVLGGLAAPAGLMLGLAGHGAEPIPKPGTTTVAASGGGLAELRSLALEKQSTLTAYRASLSAAMMKRDALANMRLAALVRRDLGVRRSQSARGVLAAEGQLAKAEWNTLYAVTRTYLSVVYAQTQFKLADEALTNKDRGLNILRDLAKKIYAGETPLRGDVKKWHVDQIESLIAITAGRREEARRGIQSAQAALREAIGVDRDCPLTMNFLTQMPEPKGTITLDQVLAHAMERRGDLQQARVAIDVTAMEIEAQGLNKGPRAETFASGSDLHAEPVLQGMANGEYRPGAISIEMPPNLAGSRQARMDQASALHTRAIAVEEKARKLVTLEAEDAFNKWEETRKQAVEYDKAAKSAETAAESIAKSFKPDDMMNRRPTLDEVIEFSLRAAQLRALANQARYNALLSLAALERITAGGFQPDFSPKP